MACVSKGFQGIFIRFIFLALIVLLVTSVYKRIDWQKAGYPLYPDSKLTPGDTLNVTKEDICKKGYSSKVRKVSESVKKKVFEEYGLNPKQPHNAYEVDHYISLELGGSNDIKNLWPEPAEPRPGYHEKDVVENYLRRQVCTGAMPLKEAQGQIMNDWYRVYLNIQQQKSPR